VREYDRLLEECEFSEAMRVVYDFAWHQFADWYVEISKAVPSKQTPRILREVFEGTLRLLHPPMPFATEEMYRDLGYQDLGAILSCGRDFEFPRGFNSRLKLTRTQTIMQGASCCDFRYRKRRPYVP
jgi:valyl-tRNA synthetase